VLATVGDPLGISLMYLHDVIPSLVFNFSLVLWWYDLDEQLRHTYPRTYIQPTQLRQYICSVQVYLISRRMTISFIASCGYCETLRTCPHYGVIHTYMHAYIHR
jgi:hypothetical protein